MNTLKITLIGLLVALAMVVSVALVIRSLPDGDPQPPVAVKEAAPKPMPPAPVPAPPPPAAKSEPPAAAEDRIPQEADRGRPEERTPPFQEHSPPAVAQPEPQAEPAPARPPFSTMQGRATELLAIPPAGVLGAPPSAQPVPPTAPAAVSANGRLVFSPAQEERVRYVLMSHNVMQTEAPDFPLQLGATVPETVRLSPLPIELAEIVPNYRAYAYVISQNRIVIVTADRRTISSLISIEARG